MVAKTLGMSVEEAQRRVPPREFLRWRLLASIEDEDKWKAKDRADYYSAKVAYEVYLLRHIVANMFSKTARKPELEYKDFLLDFEAALKKQQRRPAEKPPPKVVEAVEEEDEYGWGEELALADDETEEERQARFEEANLIAHLRWSAFLQVPLGAVGADKYVKSPDEIATRSEDGT